MKRLGISVSGDAIRAVLVRRGKIEWRGSTPVVAAERLGAAIEHLLAALPSHALRGARVHVALGLVHSHLKRIEGLPPARQPKVLDRIVKENPDTFFLRLGARSVVAELDHRSNGSTWAAALNGAVVEELVAVLRQRRLPPAMILPFVAAAAHAVPPGMWRLVDGGPDVELTTIEGNVIQACRRAVLPAGEPKAPAPANPALGPDGLDFIAAYGAAIAPAAAPFTWRAAPDAKRARRLDVLRLVAASVALVLTTGAALAARGVRATRTAAAATTQLATVRIKDADAERIDAELRRVTTELDHVNRFNASRGQISTLLGAFSEALPDSTALVSLRVDTLEVSFVALTPHAADVLPQLFDVAGAVGPRIVGSVTREVQGGARVERASFRFRRRGVAR